MNDDTWGELKEVEVLDFKESESREASALVFWGIVVQVIVARKQVCTELQNEEDTVPPVYGII